ncbi:DegT/DnrJ/EryC1/StrS family aminotransferase [Haloechinothrix sp. LS1_15]|uniref:DegT/DnrJ/EryC1/StrS family aminotransferase n=1 Tax=Haloechinothrix sp. LS1_15 TaxID=2652248 RepID=UPI0037C0D9CA
MPIGSPTVGEAELAAVAEVFRSGWLAGSGPTCRRFEERFARAVGVRHALATSSCGTALHLGLRVLGVARADEVIVADYTFLATAHAVVHAGATPVFVDVRGDTGTVDPDAVAAAVTSRTVGIIAVDVAGQPADYDELAAVARRHGLWLFEDAACAAGATYRGRPAGSLADLAAFSFHGRKGITAGEGGALVSDREELIERARRLHSYGIVPAIERESATGLPVPGCEEAGYNYRLSDVQAAIMTAQLDRLPGLLASRRAVAERYREGFADLPGVTPAVELPDREHAWQAYHLTVACGEERDRIATRLRERGIGCGFGTYACHLQPVYGSDRHLPVSARLLATRLAIPMHANLTGAEVDRVIGEVRSAVAGSP